MIAIAAALVGAPPAASAAPAWLSASKLSRPGQSAEAPQVAVDAQGDALAVWQRFSVEAGEQIIEASSRPAGSGSWQPALPISGAKAESSLPQVALDAEGDATAVWLSKEGTKYSIEASTRTGPTGSWQTPVTLAELGETPPAEPRPDLAENAQGEAVAVWHRLEGPTTIVEASSRPAAGASWLAPKTLSENGEDMHPAEVGIDAAGDATAVWEGKGVDSQIEAASRPAGGEWQPQGPISGELANEPRVAVNARGDAVAIWERFEGSEIIEAATRPAGAKAWGESVELTKPPEISEPTGQQVAIDGQGHIVVVWSRFAGASKNQDVIEASLGSVSNSAWGTPVPLSAPAALEEEAPEVSVNNRGNAIVVWEQATAGKSIVEAASGFASGASWQPAVALSGEGEEAGEEQVALDAQGNAAALWRRFDGTSSYIAEAAGFDAAGPLLDSLSIPTSGTVGQPLSFSVSPFDIWSALGATSWSFGDGASLTGASVTHTYSAPGSYRVTVTGADALANTTSATALVTVSAASATVVKEGSSSAPAIAPKITGAHLLHSRFRVSAHATAISAKAGAPLGTSFRFALSEAAKLQITFSRSAAGLRSGKRCEAPSTRLRRKHAKACKRTLTVGSLSRAQEPAGADSVAFSGRLGSRALAPGLYKALLVATTAGLKSAPVTLALTVVS